MVFTVYNFYFLNDLSKIRTEVCFHALHQMQDTLKGYSTFLGEIVSFYNSPRVKQLSFTIFESIQLIFWYLEEYQ